MECTCEKRYCDLGFPKPSKVLAKKENKENYLNESRYLMISMSTSSGKLIKVAVGDFALDKPFLVLVFWFD